MEFGVHLPQIAFDDAEWHLDRLQAYVERAEQLGFQYLCANDHLLFPRPWLDGPTALAALLPSTAMTLVTTIANPVIRHPVVLAKAVDTLDLLSGGRLIVGLGPGSSRADYEATGVAFEERWARFDEALDALRALLHGGEPFSGSFYETEGVELEPGPAQEPGPPLWVASWGSTVGLRRAARRGDGWLASGYNTTPEQFAAGRARLNRALDDAGRDPSGFDTAIATVFIYLADDAEAERIRREVLAPTLGRPADDLADRLPIGSVDRCVELLDAYREAGAERVFVWPVADEPEQLERFAAEVLPRLPAGG